MSGLEALKAIGELKENGVKINTTEEYKIVENALKEGIQLYGKWLELCQKIDKLEKLVSVNKLAL